MILVTGAAALVLVVTLLLASAQTPPTIGR
jgi:hypothetical protein